MINFAKIAVKKLNKFQIFCFRKFIFNSYKTIFLYLVYLFLNMRELTCYYHPDRKADEKCEACEKLLCLECKKVERMAHRTRRTGSSFSDHSTSSYTSHYTYHNLCPECYYDRRIASTNPLKLYLMLGMLIIASIIFIIWMVVVSSTFSSTGGYVEPMGIFVLFPILMILGAVIVGIYMIRIRNPRIREAAITKKTEFLRSVGIEPEGPRSSFNNGPR